MNSSLFARIALIFCFIVAFGLTPPNPAAQGLPHKGYLVGPGDILEIQVWDNEDLHRKIEVSQEGDFTFPLIGKVHAAGLSVFELENLLKLRLADGYLVRPQVTIKVTGYESQKVFLFGEVEKPGTYPVKTKTHLLEIIAEAGGLTPRAGQTITIVRPMPSTNARGPVTLDNAKDSEIITVDLDQLTSGGTDDRFYVTNGDSIYVSEAQRVFVTGEVNKPGELKWEKGLTVRQAISLAGGASKRAAPLRTSIIRMENQKEREIEAAMSEPVMPGDIVSVPESYF